MESANRQEHQDCSESALIPLQQVLDRTREAIAWIDRAGVLRGSNAAFRDLLSGAIALEGQHLQDLLPLSRFGQPLLEDHPVALALNGCSAGCDRYEWQRADGLRSLEIEWLPLPGDSDFWLVILRDLTEQMRLRARLDTLEARQHYDARHDSLTGLPNRRHLLELLHRVYGSLRTPEKPAIALLLLDVDRFRVINDSLGYGLGDELLRAIAQRLLDSVQPHDVVARLGGDEFGLLLTEVSAVNDATNAAAQVLQALAQPLRLGEHELFVTASVGIVLVHPDYRNLEEIVRDAGLAMRRAKQAGRSRYVVFEPSLHVRAIAQLHLETDLRRALDQGELFLQYQPIVTLGNEYLVGFEALVRWRHPQHGLISPTEFIPLAEETGLIIPIGQWVLREACQQLRRWQDQFSESQLLMSVNLSGRQFSQQDLLEQIEAILQETQLDASSLKLEITESVLMDNAESAALLLRKLQERGIKLSIDDFGTGYSSLSYLHQLPIDTLKIDRSFVKSIDSDGEKLELVRTIVTLAWHLGMDIIAEGVETPKQLAQLRSLNCEAAQGYLFSAPLDAAMAQDFIEERHQAHRTVSKTQTRR